MRPRGLSGLLSECGPVKVRFARLRPQIYGPDDAARRGNRIGFRPGVHASHPSRVGYVFIWRLTPLCGTEGAQHEVDTCQDFEFSKLSALYHEM